MNKLIAHILCLTISLFVYLPCKAQKDLNTTLQDLNRFYEQTRQDWKVPGIAIAIVKDDSLIFAKGYGVKDVNNPEPVDENTLFAIASNTKAFTATAILMLQEEGKLSLDDKVTKYLPWFELYNPFVTQQMTVRDLLCHRAGFKTFAGDLLWYGTDYSREEVVRRAKYLEPAYGFREKYGYSNIMYIAAGLIIEEVSGMRWEDFIQKRILNPLQMTRTISSITELQKTGNFASPHNDVDDDIIAIAYLNWDNAAPLGGLISSVSDMAKWIKLQLDNGVHNADTLFLKKSQEEMWEAHTLQNVSSFSKKHFLSTHFKAYGLGWELQDYHGRKIVSHGGGYDGMISRTVLVPEENLGFVILTNKNTSVTTPLAYQTLDAFLHESDTDWNTTLLEIFNTKDDTEEKPVKNTRPSLDLQDYTGIYEDKMYGKAEVFLENNKLFVQLTHTKIFKGELSHWHFNTFTIEFKEVPSLPKGKTHFSMDAGGKISKMVIDVPNPDFDFTEFEFIKLGIQ